MTPPIRSIRVPPLERADRSEAATALVESYALGADDTELNVFTTLARHPELVRRWMRFNSFMLTSGDLSAWDRELVILRTVWLCRAEYEWGHHERFAKLSGLSDAEIRSVTIGADDACWSSAASYLLRATDELHLSSAITDETWTGLHTHYDERQIIELCMLAGSYHVAAFLVNSLGIKPEDGLPQFPGHNTSE